MVSHSQTEAGALRKAALTRKAAEGDPAESEPTPAPGPVRAKRGRKAALPAADSQGDAG